VAPAASSGAASEAATDGDAVIHWNEVANATAQANAARRTPSVAILYVAMAQAAVYDSVMVVSTTPELSAMQFPVRPERSTDAKALKRAAEGTRTLDLLHGKQTL
jgi:hypothetical protein